MTNSTRDNLLGQLAELKIAGSTELAGRLGITPAAARYHLSMLRTAGLIEEVPPSFHARGRPQRLYRLPLRSSPDNLPGLCLALLRFVQSDPPVSVTGRLWDRLADYLVPDLPAAQITPPSGRLDLLRRLNLAVNRLNELNYQASWEAGPRGPRLRLHNCPFAQIWSEAPGLCQMDSALLTNLLGVPVTQLVRTAFSIPGPSICLFEAGIPKDS